MSASATLPGAAGASSTLGWAGIWLGLSLGGFFDGIVLHQVLQWHHMLTSVPDPAVSGDITLNTMADGFFHVGTYVFVLIGLALLWRARREFGAQPWARGFVGSILLGAGAFNLIEGVVDHHLLGLHHVNETVPRDQWIWWDLGFLALGAVLAAVGWALRRSPAQS